MARPRTCSVKYFCLGAVLIFLGSVLLCALGFTVVLPHKATRFWPEVACHVTNTTYDQGHCACDQQVMEYDNCIDKYPCLRVAVTFNISSASILRLLEENPTNLTALRSKLERYFDRFDKLSVVDDGQGDRKNLNGNSDVTSNFRDINNMRRSGYRHFPNNDDKGKQQFDHSDHSDTKVQCQDNDHDVTEEDNGDTESTIEDGITARNTSFNKMATDNGESHDTKSQLASTKEQDYEDGYDEISILKRHKTVLIQGLLYRRWSDSFHKTCALYECGDELWNIKEVRRFQKEWGQHGQTFPCFFDPEFPDVAVIERTPKSHAVHAMLWPALSLFTGSLIWMGMCLGCWKIETEQPQNSSAYYRGML